MNCNCIEETDKQLAEHNLKLDCIAISFKHGLLIELGTQWLFKDKAPRGKKNRPTPLIAGFCPFCGKPATPANEEVKVNL